MKRRQLMQMGLGALAGGMTLSLVGCSKKTLTQWAATVVIFLEQTLPYFTDLLPGSVATLTKAIQVAKDLKAALDAGSENAIELLNQLLAPNGLFQQIVLDAGLISGPQAKLVAGILAIAGIALNVIATALSQGAAGAPPQLVAKVKAKHAVGVNVIEAAAKSDRLTKALGALK